LSTESELARTFDDEVVERHARHFVSLLQSTLEIPNDKVRALDLTAGTGYATLPILEALPAASQVIAISDDRFRLKELHKKLTSEMRRRVFPRKDTLQRLPFADHAFDIVWACWPTRIPTPVAPILRQALRVLRPGGQIAVVVPLHGSFIELIQALGSSDSSDGEITVQRLVAETPQLDDSGKWTKLLTRCGGIEARAEKSTFEITVEPPASKDRLIARHLLPLWLGEGTKDVDDLLDRSITETLQVSVRVGCITARRGAVEIEE